MGDNEGFEVDPLKKGVSTFSQLLFSPLYNDDSVMELDLEKKKQRQQQGDGIFNPSFSKSENNPKMLCFSENYPSESGVMFSETVKNVGETHRRSGVTFSEGGNNRFKALEDYHRKRNGPPDVEIGECMDSCKKIKTEHRNPTSVRRVKVRKEKLGERITALQQLVSPYGKTDTASVLHEAMGYIRFLHDQVQVLISPYLQKLPEDEEHSAQEGKNDLRSQGLCLVPVGCTQNIASNNGADFWSPAMTTATPSVSSVSSSTIKP